MNNESLNQWPMTIRRTAWLPLLYLLSSSCNRVIDSQQALSPPAETIPASAIQTIVTRFPQAESIIYTPIERNQVWQVSLQQKAVPYRAVTNPQAVLAAYQWAPAGTSIPDSLARQLTNTVVAGGALSNLRIQTYASVPPMGSSDQVVLADYAWQNSRYTVRWTITTLSQVTYLLEVLPDTQLQYQTVSLADLPPLIQQSLANQLVTFSSARVQVDGQAKKRYTITVQQNSQFYTLLYTDEGQLLGAINPSNAQVFTATDQLPASIQTYLSNTVELANFTRSGQFSRLAKTQYQGLETYTVNLQKGRQTWFMTFNGQGQLLTRSFLCMV